MALARESLDLSEVIGSYKGDLGQPPFNPRTMVALLCGRINIEPDDVAQFVAFAIRAPVQWVVSPVGSPERQRDDALGRLGPERLYARGTPLVAEESIEPILDKALPRAAKRRSWTSRFVS